MTVINPGGGGGGGANAVTVAAGSPNPGTPGQQIIVRSDGTVKYTDMPTVSAKAWGAKGDGTTDDGPAFNAAIGQVNTLGCGRIEVDHAPGGFYKIATSLDMSHIDGLEMVGPAGGAGNQQPELRYVNATGSLIKGFSAISVLLEGLFFSVSNAAYTGDLLAFDNAPTAPADCNEVRIKRCAFKSNGSSGCNSLLRVNHIINSSVDECAFFAGTGNCNILLGNNAGSPLPNQNNQYVNIFTIARSQFLAALGATGAHIKVYSNDGETLTIRENTFEDKGGNGAIWGAPGNNCSPNIENNWFGDDASNLNVPWINDLSGGRLAGNAMFWNGDTSHPGMTLRGNLWVLEGGYIEAPISGPSTGSPGRFVTAGFYFGFVGATPANCMIANPANVGAGKPEWVDLGSYNGDPGRVAAPYVQATGVGGGGFPTSLTSRWVGCFNGSPGSGTWALGDWCTDQTGRLWLCTVAGSPGTWVQIGNDVTLTGTQTFTNKRITARVVTVTQSATPTINTDNTDVAAITGLAQAITSMTTNLSGTPVDGDALLVRITDNGTARAITWGSKFEASTIALPTTTVGGAMLITEFLWNTASSKWRCVGVA